MKQPKNASTAIGTPGTSAAPTNPALYQSAQQPAPWFVTRDEQIRLKALELAIQTANNPNKIELARSYMRFLKPEADTVCDGIEEGVG